MQENRTTFRPSRDRRRILLIEDEYFNQEILKKYLEDSYDLVVAGTGTEALNIIRSQYKMLSLILLAESFELPTIAEGVETAEQMFTLKKMGCAIIQGYYFSRPLPAEEFEMFIAERKDIEPRAEAKRSLTRKDKLTTMRSATP